MFKRKKTIIALILLIVIVGSFFYFKNKKPETEYTTSEAYRGTLARTVSVTGKLVALEETDLSFKLSGRVEKIFVDIGDKVKKGQLVAVVDKGTLLGQLQEAQAQISVEKNALKNMIRRKNTFKKEEEASQRARIRKAEAAKSEILTQISETSLYSPIDGIVIRKNVNVGETTVANAVTANTSVVTVAKEGNLEIESNVPESDIIKIALDQNADVALDAFTARDIFSAKISEIEPASTVIQDVVYYKTKLTFENNDSRFKNGMSADIDIHTAEKSNVIIIPLRAIKAEENDKFVDVLESDGMTVRKVKIITGLEGDEGMVEVVSGLSGGEKVVTFTKTP